MATRITIYDRTGVRLAEVNACPQYTWLVGDAGSCTFTMSTADPKLVRRFFQAGNFVLIEHDKLPPWGGSFEKQRKWDGYICTITALSAEYMFAKRRGNPTTTLKGGTAACVLGMLQQANQPYDTLIRPGVIVDVDPQHQKKLRETDLLTQLKELASEAYSEWQVIPTLDGNNRLSFLLNWYPKMGITHVTHLVEGFNIKQNSAFLTENFNMVNDYLGYGDGSNWATKPVAYLSDPTSQAQYGLYQGTKYFQGDTTTGVVTSDTQSYLNVRSQPNNVFKLDVLNVGTIFQELHLGDTFPLEMHHTGFGSDAIGEFTSIRINNGMTYNGDVDTVSLMTKEIQT